MSKWKRRGRPDAAKQAKLFDIKPSHKHEVSLLELLMDIYGKWTRHAPASEAAISNLIQQSSVGLPDDYLTLLRYSNGGEGLLAVAPWWFRIYSAEEALEFHTRYGIDRYLPGYFTFGSDGGGELLVFNTREKPPCKVYYVPAVETETDSVLECAKSFKAFAKAMGREAKAK